MIGIILMSYGGPERIDQVESFFTQLLQGRKPSAEQVEALTNQFRSLGTVDPLRMYTERQAHMLQQVLHRNGVANVKVYFAYKNGTPFIGETIGRMLKDKVSQIVTLPLNPFYSKTGVGSYQREVETELEKAKASTPVFHIERWYQHEGYEEVMVRRVSEALQWLPQTSSSKRATIVFTTHSLPGSSEQHQAYITQLSELAQQIANKLNVQNWRMAYRSARQKQGWLGPDIKDVIFEEATNGQNGLVVCDLLSVSENVEVLQELRTECQEHAKDAGIEYVCADFPNDSADFMFALADIVEAKLKLIGSLKDPQKVGK
ncbi:ferrochelatase [Ammoniphilus oxalaticus]|uniref:Ferrochelatase n=1 Tax=Ammoniphilus oxalaticus TaxID=66863 RepID=A0A419SGL5_9BACL|nr:ferrochelatase [Ammoniphilus oxalaticus]RKD22923.1 ferrochelatase [Ammoniphilus oxalaticus]